MRQDEELERLLEEIPSSAQEKASASSSADGSISDDEQPFSDFYPNQLDSRSGGEAGIDPGDIDLWRLNLGGGGGGGGKKSSEADNVIRSPPQFDHPQARFWLSNEGRNAAAATPTTRWMLTSGGPVSPVQLNPYHAALENLHDTTMSNRVLQYPSVEQEPFGYSSEADFDVARFVNHHFFLQQQQQQQQRQIMEEQARVFAAAMAEQQKVRKQPATFYVDGDTARYNLDRAKVNGLQLLRQSTYSGNQYYQRRVHETILNSQHKLKVESEQSKYTSVQEVKGRIYMVAKDQLGCRFLQRRFEEKAGDDAEVIFEEIIDHVVDLMTDPFGNYLVQKVLEVCDHGQRCRVVRAVTSKSQLVNISLNMHGTRAVQKLIAVVETAEQVSMVVASLRPGVVTLIKDTHGNHVVQQCLNLSKEHKQFIYDAAVSHCVEIASHRHGCCVLQRCVDHATGPQCDRLVAEISANALILSQDAFGNYVVQYILNRGWSWVFREVISRLSGEFAQLAMQKFSSNVVEKCLNLADEEDRRSIIQELVSSPSFDQLLHHEYANYVIQSALVSSKGLLRCLLVEAIRPHIPALRSSPYGKRILSRTTVSRTK